MNYENKYTKYKNKYLKLKKQLGGNWLNIYLKNKTEKDFLAKGGFGKVYEFNFKNKKYVVKELKKIKNGIDRSEQIVKEYKFLKNIKYPLASYSELDLVSDKDYFYISMNNIDGQDGIDYLEKNLHSYYRNLNNSLFIFLQMVFINYYLHSNGLVHLDLKLDNYMIEEINGKPYLNIIDFGLAECLKKGKFCEKNQSIDNTYKESVDVNKGTDIYFPFSMLDENDHYTSYNDDYYLITLTFFSLFGSVIGRDKYIQTFERQNIFYNLQFFEDYFKQLKIKDKHNKTQTADLLKYFVIDQKYRYYEFISYLYNKLNKLKQFGGALNKKLFFDNFNKNINDVKYLEDLLNSENINLLDDNNNSLIQLAINNNADTKIINLLIKKGINLNFFDDNKNNLINLAILSKNNIINKKVNNYEYFQNRVYKKISNYNNIKEKINNKIQKIKNEIKDNKIKIENLEKNKAKKREKIQINSLEIKNNNLIEKINSFEQEKEKLKKSDKVNAIKDIENKTMNIENEINSQFFKLRNLIIILLKNNIDIDNINNDGNSNYDLINDLENKVPFRLDNTLRNLLEDYGIKSKDYHRFMAIKALSFFKSEFKIKNNLNEKFNEIFDYIDSFKTINELNTIRKNKLINYFNELIDFKK